MERHVGGEQERVGPGHRPDPPGRSAHPRHHRAVVHADHQVHAHGHTAAAAHHLADQHRRPVAPGHAVHDRHRAAVGLELGLQDQGAVAVVARAGGGSAAREDREAAVLGPAHQGREAGPRIEAGQAEPVDRAAARDQGCGLAVADQRVVLDGIGHVRGGFAPSGAAVPLTSPGRHVSVTCDFTLSPPAWPVGGDTCVCGLPRPH